jgi:hypothetical protein
MFEGLWIVQYHSQRCNMRQVARSSAWRITISLWKLCPVHRGSIAMSGRVAQVGPKNLGLPGLAFETWDRIRNCQKSSQRSSPDDH